MKWYVVVKSIKGYRYRYRQRTWREGDHVRTESKYLGPATDAPRSRPIVNTTKREDVKPGDVVAWPVWRAESGYRHERGATAWDVVSYESEDLGNDYLREQVETVCSEKSLRERVAGDLIWVTRKAGDARRYGRSVKRVELPTGSIVLAKDRDGGLLVLRGGQSVS